MLGYRRNPYRELEGQIGYRFRKRSMLETALTHRSFRFENEGIADDNQRLEFFGDAVLSFVIAAHLYERFTGKDEGFLTALRSQTTSGKVLAEIASAIQLGRHIRIGKGEERSGGRDRPSSLADALEAVIGAAYLDGGLKAVNKMFKKLFIPLIESLSGDVWADNPKGQLQEYSQRKLRSGPRYHLVQRVGPPHATIFVVQVTLADGTHGIGRGRSKQEAETIAAIDALKKANILRHDKRPV